MSKAGISGSAAAEIAYIRGGNKYSRRAIAHEVLEICCLANCAICGIADEAIEVNRGSCAIASAEKDQAVLTSSCGPAARRSGSAADAIASLNGSSYNPRLANAQAVFETFMESISCSLRRASADSACSKGVCLNSSLELAHDIFASSCVVN